MAKLTKRMTEQLESYLGSLSADELVEVLLSHAARDDALRDRLLIESAKRGAGAVDLKSFQRSINAAVFDLAESRHGSEYPSGEWANGVNQVAQRLDELLEAGQAAAVVALAEHALQALVEVMDRADDSSGYISDLVADFERLHHDACISAGPEPVALANRLFTWEVDGHWDVFVDAASRYADVLGPESRHRTRLAHAQRSAPADRWPRGCQRLARRRCGSQGDCFSPDRVVSCLQPRNGDHVDRTPQKLLELVLQMEKVEQGAAGLEQRKSTSLDSSSFPRAREPKREIETPRCRRAASLIASRRSSTRACSEEDAVEAMNRWYVAPNPLQR
jgi:hypothetical protein